MHHEGNGWRVFTNNKLDWIIVGKNEINTMRFVVMIVVVVFINIMETSLMAWLKYGYQGKAKSNDCHQHSH
jgi:hypothetical protein